MSYRFHLYFSSIAERSGIPPSEVVDGVSFDSRGFRIFISMHLVLKLRGAELAVAQTFGPPFRVRRSP